MDSTIVKEAKAIYQAIGVIAGLISIKDSEHTLTIHGYTYKLCGKRRTLRELQHEKIQALRVYPDIDQDTLIFNVLSIVNPVDCCRGARQFLTFYNQLRVFSLKGCWESRTKGSRFIVYRNKTHGRNRKVLWKGLPETVLNITWPDAPPADGQFYELTAYLERDSFVVREVIRSGEAPQKLDISARETHN
jgi:hypothetical protein